MLGRPLLRLLAVSAIHVTLPACTDTDPVLPRFYEPNHGCTPVVGLVINEVVTRNHGTAVDREGDADDWIEIGNASKDTLDLSHVTLSDAETTGRLPPRLLGSGERLVLFADDDVSAGAGHLPFRLAAEGEWLRIHSCGELLEELRIPTLDADQALARFPDLSGNPALCRYTSVGRANPPRCTPEPDPGLAVSHDFAKHAWELPHPAVPSPLNISEMALFPASFIELLNSSEEELDLAGYTLSLAPLTPSQPTFDPSLGTTWSLEDLGSLAPSAHLIIDVTEADLLGIATDPNREGRLSLASPEGESGTTCIAGGLMKAPGGGLRDLKGATRPTCVAKGTQAPQAVVAPVAFPLPLVHECMLGLSPRPTRQC